MSTRDPLDGDTGDTSSTMLSSDSDLLDGDTGDADASLSVGSQLGEITGGDVSTDQYPLPIAIGEKFYRYTLNGLLGRGGTGVVYSAVTKRRSDAWAIKILWPELRIRPDVEQHFRNGHLLVKDLYQQVSGVVPVHDVADKKGYVFVRMDPIVGASTLGAQLHPPSDRETLRHWLQTIFRPLCETVDNLHDLGIVHCDLKADNILLTDKGPIIIDFGLAMDVRGGLQSMKPSLGTQTIMAPEQYRGQGVGPSVDRYALGLLIYRLLSGQYPWSKGASYALIQQNKDTNQLIPLKTSLTEQLTGIADIVHKMLQRDPAQRFSRCIDFYHRLVECTDAVRIVTSPIEKDDRIRLHSYAPDVLEPKRLSSIQKYYQQLQQREPDLVTARNRIEELQSLLQRGIGGQGELQEIHHLLQQFPLWELAPLQQIPFSSPDGQVLPFRLLPAGRFQMGSAKADMGADGSEKPRFGVHISEGFWMSITPVTHSFYASVMGEDVPTHAIGSHPVNNVSWYEAILFCNRFSQQHKFQPVYRIQGTQVSIDPSAGGYRLPTEAEWEFAAIANQPEFEYAGANKVDAVAWCSHNSSNTTHPVAQKDSNGFGLFDMSGNVLEWCWDKYGDYPETTERSLFQYDPKGASKGDARVLRGGSYQSTLDQVRCKSRWSADPNEKLFFVGIRLVQSVRR